MRSKVEIFKVEKRSSVRKRLRVSARARIQKGARTFLASLAFLSLSSDEEEEEEEDEVALFFSFSDEDDDVSFPSSPEVIKMNEHLREKGSGNYANALRKKNTAIMTATSGEGEGRVRVGLGEPHGEMRLRDGRGGDAKVRETKKGKGRRKGREEVPFLSPRPRPSRILEWGFLASSMAS